MHACSITKSCPTLYNPTNCSPPGSSVQARTLEGLPFPPPVDLPNPGIKPAFPVSAALAGGFFTTQPPGKL